MIDIQFEGMKHIDEFVNKVAPEVVKIATRNAVNKTLSKTKTRSVRGIARSSRVKPAKLIKARFRMFLANKKNLAGAVIFKHTSLPVELLATKSGVQWNRKMAGARVRGKTYVGSFGATPTKGSRAGKFKRVYERVAKTGDNKNDLHVKRIEMKPFGPIVKKVGQRTTDQMLVDTFHKQLKWLLQKNGYISGGR